MRPFIFQIKDKEQPSPNGFGKGVEGALSQQPACRRVLALQFLGQQAWHR